MSSSTNESEPISVPEKFPSTIVDFVNDLTATFPEYAEKWSKYIASSSTDCASPIFNTLFAHCLTVFPERFFDILNQNAEIFDEGSEINTFFLPDVDFKVLYHCAGVSENTRQSIWKYLQVILFMLVGSVKDKSDFGDAMNMFDGLEEGDLADKMKTVMSGISDFFGQMEKGSENIGVNAQGEGSDKDENIGQDGMENAFKKAFSFMEQEQNGSDGPSSSSSSTPSPNLPKPEDLNDHLKNLFNGKIGSLAKELAEDIGQDLAGAFGEDMQNIKSTKDVFAKLMQNPQKISGLVKTVGEKLNQKMASGDISRDDLMGEAGDLMRKMKEMGGGENFADMFKNMAKGMGMNIPKGAKFNQNAMDQMEKKMTMRDKLKSRMEQKQAQKAATEMAEQAKIQKQYEDYARFMAANPEIAKAAENFTLANTQDANHKVFSIKGGETQEKTMANSNGTNAMTSETGEGPAKLTTSQKKKAKAKAKKQAAKQVEADPTMSTP